MVQRNRPAVAQRDDPDRNIRKRIRLSDLCAETLMLILHLRVAKGAGDAASLRPGVHDLLGKLDREAMQAGIDSEDVRKAKFALVTFLDEAVSGSSLNGKDVWLANPMQLELFNRNDGGEEFFKQLEQLRQRRDAGAHVLEVYFLCMALGFKGKFQYQGKDRLRTLVDEIKSDLLHLTNGKSGGALSPNGIPNDKVVDVVMKQIPVWVIVVAAAALCIFFLLTMRILIGNAADDVVQVIKNII